MERTVRRSGRSGDGDRGESHLEIRAAQSGAVAVVSEPEPVACSSEPVAVTPRLDASTVRRTTRCGAAVSYLAGVGAIAVCRSLRRDPALAGRWSALRIFPSVLFPCTAIHVPNSGKRREHEYEEVTGSDHDRTAGSRHDAGGERAKQGGQRAGSGDADYARADRAAVECGNPGCGAEGCEVRGGDSEAVSGRLCGGRPAWERDCDLQAVGWAVESTGAVQPVGRELRRADRRAGDGLRDDDDEPQRHGGAGVRTL